MSNTVTIVFRGLMVFHDDVDNKRMEIGILPTKSHFPRIMTIKNGVLFSVRPIQPEIDGRDRIWEFQADGAIGGPIRRQSGPDFKRLTHGAESDFRWVIDLENDEFPYGDLTKKLYTGILKPLLFVPTGEFYTKLRSPTMNILNNTASTIEAYGQLTAVLGLDIPLTGTTVNLVEKKTGDSIFEFVAEPNTIYEFSNAPPDISEHVHTGEEEDHFKFYYKLFTDPEPEPQFSFEEKVVLGGPPGPNPLLCGVLFLGKRSTPFD